MTCLTFLGLCPDTWSKQVGIPVGNKVCLCVYSRKSLTLDKQAQFFFFFLNLQGMFDIGLPWGLSGKEPACQCRRCVFDPWVGKIPGERSGNPVWYSCLRNPMDRGAWWAVGHGVAKSRIRPSNTAATTNV